MNQLQQRTNFIYSQNQRDAQNLHSAVQAHHTVQEPYVQKRSTQRLLLRGTGFANQIEPQQEILQSFPGVVSDKEPSILPQIQRSSLLAQEIAVCNALGGLTSRQRQICLRHTGLVWAMLEGTQLGLHECVHQFRHEQWNCSAVNLLHSLETDAEGVQKLNGLEGILQRGSKETAFLSSTWSAGVAQAITRACSRGQMGTCDCDPNRREGQDQDTNGIFTWGGCSDPIKFGMRLARLFLDANDKELLADAVRREQELHGSRSPQSQTNVQTQRHRATRWRRRRERSTGDDPTSLLSAQNAHLDNSLQESVVNSISKTIRRVLSPQQLQTETLRIMQTKAGSLMNLHNRRAGRRLVWVNRVRKCKCHGVSGACTMRTCWQRVGDFRRVGHHLKKAYNDAIRVTFDPKKGSLKPVNRDVSSQRIWFTVNENKFGSPILTKWDSPQITKFGDEKTNQLTHRKWRMRRRPRALFPKDSLSKNKLVYLEESPNYCRHDPAIGHFGIGGRKCNGTSTSLPNSCNRLCCDRGYERIHYDVQHKCNCKFFWCCEVRCETCLEHVVEHRCRP